MMWSEDLVQQYLDSRTNSSAPEEHMVESEVFTTSRVGDGGALPGKPTHPILGVERAKQDEILRTRRDPQSALEWDRKSDARYLAWVESPFAEAVGRLLHKKYAVGFG